MKRLIIFIVLFSASFSVFAQMTRKPTFRPDWTFKAPAPENATYLYVVEHGEGQTKRDALNQAICRVFQSTANRIGQYVSTDEINRAVQTGTDYEVISRKMKVPVNKVCEFAVQDPVDYTWTMYILCQVAKAGNITPQFETTEECTKHKMFDEAMERWNKQKQDSIDAIADNVHRSNVRAITASAFIPGMGQMLKGQWGSGAAFLVSELALFGGGTACYFLGQDQLKISKTTGDYNEYSQAIKTKNTLDIAMFTCFGVGAAMHIANMVHAWYVKDKHLPNTLSFAPAIIQTNEYTTPSYAYGAGVQIKF